MRYRRTSILYTQYSSIAHFELMPDFSLPSVIILHLRSIYFDNY